MQGKRCRIKLLKTYHVKVKQKIHGKKRNKGEKSECNKAALHIKNGNSLQTALSKKCNKHE